MSDVLLPSSSQNIRPEQPWFVLGVARHYSVLASANPAISHFYSFDMAQTSRQTLAIPDGCVDIIFDCDANNPSARVCGTTIEARSADFIQGHHYFGVRFAPGVMPDFLDLMAEELTDQQFSFLDVIPDARLAFERIVETRQFSQQMALFNYYFTPRLIRRPSSTTPSVIQAIRQQRGNIRLEQLETLTGFTCRTLQRQFRQDTGMSPKVFSRIIRCQSALKCIHLQREMTFSDLAFDLGFSDQSHFLREFKKLVSTTPLDYQRRVAQATYEARIHYD